MSGQEQWSAVERYFTNLIVPTDSALDGALQRSREAGLPEIHVAPNEGKLLHLLARTCNARNILEVGTLGGYSTIWLARALPADGKLITLEYSEKHAAIARANIDRAGLAERVEIMVGDARQSMRKLIADLRGPFDFIFIDADKSAAAEYFDWAVRLARPGSVIVVDNVVRTGEVIDPKSTDASVQGIRRFNEALARDPRVSATAIQTVGSKGYDGFVLAVVK